MSDRSAEGGGAGLTTVCAVAELLPVSGSAVEDVTDAVFERAPSVVGVTLMVTVAEPPAAIDPSWHETVAAPVHEPWLGVAEPNVTDPGSVSVTTTFDATLVDDAGFATVMV